MPRPIDAGRNRATEVLDAAQAGLQPLKAFIYKQTFAGKINEHHDEHGEINDYFEGFASEASHASTSFVNTGAPSCRLK